MHLWKRILTWQGPVVYRTAEEFAKFLQLAGSFLSYCFVDSLDNFCLTLSVTHTIAVISPGNSVPFQTFFPKIQQRANVSQLSCLELLMTTSNPWIFSDSIQTVSCVWESNTRNINHVAHSGKERRACRQRIGKTSAIHIVQTDDSNFPGYQSQRINIFS